MLICDNEASSALSKQIKDMYLNVESIIFLFDTYISSILNYVSKVWVMDKGVNIEKLHLGPPQTRVKKQETKRFSTFAVSRLRHSKTKKNIA